MTNIIIIIIIIICGSGGGGSSSNSSSSSSRSSRCCNSSTPSSCSTKIFHVHYELIVMDTNIFYVINISSSVEENPE